MKAIQRPLDEPGFDNELAMAATYVDEDDHAIDCDALDDTKMLSVDRSSCSFEPD